MCDPISAVLAVTAVASGVQGYNQNKKQEEMAKRQAAESKAQADIQASKRQASSNYLFDVDTESGGSDVGLGNTFLTGSQGVNTDQINLGGVKNNILGG